MKRMSLAVALAASVTLVLAACSPGGTTTPTADKVTDLNIGNFLDVTSWDPSLADIGFDGPYMSAIYDPLLALDADGNPTAALATDWKVSDDQLKVTMDLRTDAVFSDGAKFDADAAVASLEYLQKGARSSEAYLNVKTFKAVDKDTIEIDLSKRDDTMLYLMGLGRSYMMSPAAIKAGTLATTPVGSGPYTLDKATTVAGSEYHFTKVAKHWDSKTYPFTKLAIFPILDATARHNAMLSGQVNVNFADPLNIKQAKELGWSIASKASGWVGLQFVDHTGSSLKALGDLKVRQALNYAFDGAAILKSVGSGAGTVTNQVFPVDSAGYDKGLNGMYAFNLDKAKSLLADAGYADGFSLHMPMSPIFQQWQPVVDQTFGELKIKVTWDDLQMPDYQINAPTYPMFISYLAMDSNAPATVARQLTNVQWYNPAPQAGDFPEVQSIVDDVTSQTGDKQLASIGALNKKLTGLAWWDVWYQANNTYFSVKGVKVTPITGMMFPTLRYIQQG